MLLVDRLAGDAQRLGHERPRPAVPDRALDFGVLELVGEPPERDGAGEAVRGVSREIEVDGRFVTTSFQFCANRRAPGVSEPIRTYGR